MARRNYNGVQINQSVTIVAEAGVEIADVRNRIMKFDDNGNVVLATAGADIPVGIALIEAGINDISGKDSGKAAAGDDIDIQIKDIGVVLAGATVKKGQEITAMAGGLATPAVAGNYVLGYALANAEADQYLPVQIFKYQKNA